jgi:hypothetical protein
MTNRPSSGSALSSMLEARAFLVREGRTDARPALLRFAIVFVLFPSPHAPQCVTFRHPNPLRHPRMPLRYAENINAASSGMARAAEKSGRDSQVGDVGVSDSHPVTPTI